MTAVLMMIHKHGFTQRGWTLLPPEHASSLDWIFLGSRITVAVFQAIAMEVVIAKLFH